uniref:Uncharacterized protein n=2 Tax=Oryza brachyantha TaxID=4533 RepID=J3LED7_ORYBR
MSSSPHGCLLLHHAGHGHAHALSHSHSHGRAHTSTRSPSSAPPPPPPAASPAIATTAIAPPVTKTAPPTSAPGADEDEWGGLLRREPPEAGLLQDVLHGFYPTPTRRPHDDDLRDARPALKHERLYDASPAASPWGIVEGDRDEGDYNEDDDDDNDGDYRVFPMMPQGLLEDVIQCQPYLEVFAAHHPQRPKLN